MSKILTQKRVQELFDYNPDTGELIRKVSIQGASAGVAGSNCKGYLQVMVDCKMYRVNRIIWLWVHGCFPDQIDHINQCRDDNRLVNLRAVSHQENSRNRSISSGNTSGFTGVNWYKPTEKWQISNTDFTKITEVNMKKIFNCNSKGRTE